MNNNLAGLLSNRAKNLRVRADNHSAESVRLSKLASDFREEAADIDKLVEKLAILSDDLGEVLYDQLSISHMSKIT